MKYKVNINDLAKVNEKTTQQHINVGEVLRIPGNKPDKPTPTEQPTRPTQPTQPPKPTQGPAPEFSSHKVISGESWWGISRKYGVNMTELARVNGRSVSQHIMVGEILRIPGHPRPTVTPKPTTTPTITAKPTQRPLPTQTPTPTRIPTPSPTPRLTQAPTPTDSPGGYVFRHQVTKGETWISIAAKYRINTADLARGNNRTLNDTIVIGESLVIPPKGQPTPTPTPYVAPTLTPIPTKKPSPTQIPTPTKRPQPTKPPTPTPILTPTRFPSPTLAPHHKYPNISPAPKPDISHLDPKKPTVALTWDDGPVPYVDEQIIAALNKNKQKGTFFLVGLHIHPDRAQRLPFYFQGGHEIGNHSFNHKLYERLTVEQVKQEIGRTDAYIHMATGRYPTVLRPPGGSRPRGPIPGEKRPFIYWTLDPLDYKSNMTEQKIYHDVMSRIKDGDIVLLHSLYTKTRAASIRMINDLTKQGYQLVTVSELIAFKEAYRK